MSRRINWIDIARGIAMCAIVLGHTLPSSDAKTMLYAFHVPLFFLLSGLTFSFKPGFVAFVKKMATRLLIPYFIFGLISIAVYCAVGSFAASERGSGGVLGLPEMLTGLIYGSGTGQLGFNKPLWFLPCLFSLEILCWLIHRFTDKGSRSNLHHYVIASVVVCALGIIANYCGISMLPFGIVTAFYMLPFFVVGEISKRIMTSHAERSRVRTGLASLLVLVFGMAFAVINYKITGQNQMSYPHNVYGILPLFYLGAFGMSAGVIGASIVIGKCSLLELVGKNTLEILVLHKYPILLFQIVAPKFLSSDIYYYACFVAAGIAIGTSMLIALPISKFTPWAFGKKQRNQG